MRTLRRVGTVTSAHATSMSRNVPAFEPLSTSTLRFCANSRSSGFRLGVEYCDVVLIVDSKRLQCKFSLSHGLP